ncbi:MAG: c-type cytochrome biogenesis protein CcmI [Burkholderiales bacterium]|nr:c-type cytochrome biogenesis protein CcmI [Burkholderiales bacterium]
MSTSPLFWILALALVAATLAWLVVPLLRRASAADDPADESLVTAVFRDHRRQIDADYAAGTITPAERETALSELTRRFGQELAQAGSADEIKVGERSRWIAALVLVACVPVVSGVMYVALGSPAALSPSATAPRDPIAGDPQILAMVEQLANRLNANPEDGEGWAMLGRSYRALGRPELSAQAYAEAAKRLPPNAAVYTDWAEAIALGQDRSLAGQPTELLDRALAIDPDNAKALALAGAAAAERNDAATAIRHWTRLKTVLPPDSPLIAEVDRRLATVGAAAAPPASATTPAPAATVTGPSVAGRVSLDPKLAKNVAPGDTVFIFARDPDGSRMPLAVMRVAASELPRTFVLTDAMAMSPAATISKATKVVVEARISKSGDAKAQPGDLSGTSSPVAPGARDVAVTIDQVVP